MFLWKWHSFVSYFFMDGMELDFGSSWFENRIRRFFSFCFIGWLELYNYCLVLGWLQYQIFWILRFEPVGITLILLVYICHNHLRFYFFTNKNFITALFYSFSSLILLTLGIYSAFQWNCFFFHAWIKRLNLFYIDLSLTIGIQDT